MSAPAHAKPGRLAALFRPAVPVHKCPDSAGVMPCCGLTPFEVPRTDRVTTAPELVTCNASARRAAA